MVTTALVGFGVGQRVNEIASVVTCQAQMVDKTHVCAADEPRTPAFLAGIRTGDKIVAVDSVSVSATDDALVSVINTPLTQHVLTLSRGGAQVTAKVTATEADLPYADSNGNIVLDAKGKPALKRRAYIGVGFAQKRVPAGIPESISRSFAMAGDTLGMIGGFPQQIYSSLSGLVTGEKRDPNGAVSIVGVGQVAGSITSNADTSWADRIFMNLYLIGSLNLALFAFNMIPLPPLDGGHIAGAVYEYIKRGLFRLFGKKDPGYADTALLAPLATGMFLVLLVAGVAMMLVDLVTPLKL
jgi:membrane-associated protease RseP (regulator of RpoE activity)